MAIQDKEREEIINRINALPADARLAASDAFRLGHEEGWWLARTDPESSTSPVEHAAKTNPFGAVRLIEKPCTCGARKTREACTCPHLKSDGHVVVTVAYQNNHGTWMAKSKVIPLGSDNVPVDFGMQKGDTVYSYNVKLYASKTDAKPTHSEDKPVPTTLFNSNGTFTVKITPSLIQS